MTKKRFEDHFQSDAGAFVVIPKKGTPYRADGGELTRLDQDLLAGRDPLDRPESETHGEA